MSREQEVFEKWMMIEVLIVYSNFISAAFYTFVRAFKVAPLVIEPCITSRAENDFM